MKSSVIKVLVVDDEKGIIDAVKTHLELDGFLVRIANSAEEGLELIKEDRFHIALLDINMPVMDGLELLERIKKTHGDTMVIMMTAYTSLSKVLMSRINGAADYILKPFKDLDELDSVISRAVEGIRRWEIIFKETRKVKVVQ